MEGGVEGRKEEEMMMMKRRKNAIQIETLNRKEESQKSINSYTYKSNKLVHLFISMKQTKT